jgi:threonine dehydrogenase-like Zn-dependent dehydrogenase
MRALCWHGKGAVRVDTVPDPKIQHPRDCFSHMLGGYAGGQAEFLRVPMADVGPIKVPDNVTDEQALFLSDIFPTGYMAAVNAQIEPGDTVAIWGCGPVGQFAIRSALMLGAGRVISIDEVPERLAMAEAGGAETIDFSKTDVYDEPMKRTNKRGPASCIDAVGCEASGHGAAEPALDKVKAAAFLATDRVHVLRQAIMCCRKAGTVSIPGVYVGMGDKIPLGAATTDYQDGSNPCPGLHEAAYEAHASRRYRPELCCYTPCKP